MPRKICIVTGTRAEYGLLFWLLKEVDADPELELQLVVTGAHLSEKFGNTYKVIEEDGFTIDARVDIQAGDDTAIGVAGSMGLAITGTAEAFERLKPDIVVILGDRYEILAAAQAAMVSRIPIAHIHGGELSEGAIDDAMRHAITKMAHLHFTAAKEYSRRIVQLGEDPARVFNVGAPGLDNIQRLTLLTRNELERTVGSPLGEDYFLVTYHPATASRFSPEAAVRELIQALENFPGHHVLATGVNADPGHSAISKAFADYAQSNPDRVCLHSSLGQLRYLSAVRHSAAVIGNSSSGLIEAPALKVPTVNIGERQKGRLKAPSVIDCPEAREDITAAIKKALSADFRSLAETAENPYGGPGASERIKEVLKSAPLEGIQMKRFHDISAGNG